MPALETSSNDRPCLILAHADAAYAAATGRAFRRLGWDVYPAQSGPEARRLTRMLEPQLVVLDADLAGESGWLTCAKLTRERPGARVLLVGAEADPRDRSRAAFVGALGLIAQGEGLPALLDAYRGKPLSAAG